MTKIISNLPDILENLLDTDFYMTAEHMAEELRIEYPEQYQKIIQAYAEKYDLSGCGMHMSPVTAVLNALNFMLAEGLVEKKRENGITSWRKVQDEI